jgi:hypothetical protein
LRHRMLRPVMNAPVIGLSAANECYRHSKARVFVL